jgi:hypothetical protein
MLPHRCGCATAGWGPETTSGTGAAELRAQRLHLRSEHAAEPDRGDGRRGGSQQVDNQFGTQRFALLFEPGTYGSATTPLIFQVGYYTTVAGLGASPTDVTINGAIDVFNHCDPGGCTALVNFWRSLSNLTINVTLPKTPPTYVPAPPESAGCTNTTEFWATSQASPVRAFRAESGPAPRGRPPPSPQHRGTPANPPRWS